MKASEAPALFELPSNQDLLDSKKIVFIIWNPDYYKPPSVVFQTRDSAEVSAKAMAERYPGDKFYVCRLESFSEAPKTAAKTEKLKGETK